VLSKRKGPFKRRPLPDGRRDRPIRTVRADKPIVQPPSVALRVAILGTLAIAVFVVILFRLWFLQILTGTQYVAQANDNRLRTVKLVPPRGTIVDRNGRVLVGNRPGNAIGIRPMDVPPGELDPLIRRLARVLRVPRREIRRQLREHASNPYDLVVIKEDVGRRVFSYILERKSSFPGVEVQKNYLRDYPGGTLAAQLLGYTGEISAQQLEQSRFKGYSPGDVIGLSGVEYTYDRWLRGYDGALKVEVDAFGRPKKTVPGGRLPVPGDSLVLTIDQRIQRTAERAVQQGIDLAHAGHNWGADAGAAVVMDARNGELLAMASYPTYDPAVFANGLTTKEWKALTRPQANHPLMNRAAQEAKGVGSTFKLIDAVAGLEEGVISPYTTFTCTGSLESYGQTFRCWIYPGAHGTVALDLALEESCDVYFYNVGLAFYHRQGTELEDWATRLGLGHATGLDIPGEVPGRVPTPEWRKEYFSDPVDKLWKPGNSINLAIGQGDLEVTPLQMAVAYAAVANGGSVVVPHLGLKVVSADGALVQRFPGPPKKKLDISLATLDAVRRGIRLASSGPVGTSTSVFAGFPVAVAGKTGTAQVYGKQDYSWYVSWAPADDPKYVVAVMIEQGGHGGAAAAPAARLIYDALFNVRGDHAQGATRSD
jgi:penicillin-binding protein 2